MMPEKFTNVTNGVTPRRFMVVSNPKLSRLISSRIGEGWIKHLQELRGLESSAGRPGFSKERGKKSKGKTNKTLPF
jgi:glycogen phosphorylase